MSTPNFNLIAHFETAERFNQFQLSAAVNTYGSEATPCLRISGVDLFCSINQLQTIHTAIDKFIREHEQKEAEKHAAIIHSIVQEAIDEPSHPVEHPADNEVYF